MSHLKLVLLYIGFVCRHIYWWHKIYCKLTITYYGILVRLTALVDLTKCNIYWCRKNGYFVFVLPIIKILNIHESMHENMRNYSSFMPSNMRYYSYSMCMRISKCIRFSHINQKSIAYVFLNEKMTRRNPVSWSYTAAPKHNRV